jgi:signal peptidase I
VFKILVIIGRFILDFIETIVTALVLFVIIYLFLFQPHQVKGSSMQPNFENGEYLLTNKITYRFNQPQRGDIVIFKAPPKQEYDYIKRIIGLPGDQVSLQKGKLFINGSLLDETSYLPQDTFTSEGHFLPEGKEITVPEKQYFVVGDNRLHSSDSRDWGYIMTGDIVGKAWLRYWPADKFGFIPTIAR